MHLAELSLTGFRNLENTHLRFPEEGVAVVGPNAQGKSNLLEAVYYLESLRSFRGSGDRDLVRFGQDFFRIEGRVVTGPGDTRFRDEAREMVVAAGWLRTGRRKKVTLDGEEPPRLGDGVGHVGAVLFTPADLALVNEGPQLRRRFLDILLSLNEPGYLEALQRFRQALAQRNAALRESQGAKAAQAWDPLLVRDGAYVTLLRGAWIHGMSREFSRIHAEISGEEMASMGYEPGIPELAPPPWDHGMVAEGYRAALKAAREREERQGTTVIGPHRDEMSLVLGEGDGGREVRRYGSGGQRRSVALTLRLLEAETIRSRKGREPILLMDDILAELDEDRTERVLGLLNRTAVGQVILTAPRDEQVRVRGGGMDRWSIQGGRIRT